MANILIADDDSMITDLYKLKFTKLGHNVSIGPDQESFFAQLKQQKPDVILLDRHFGSVDGLTLLQQLRGEANGANVHVMMLTNQDPTTEDLAIVGKFAPCEYMIKANVDLNQLSAKISTIAKPV